MQWVKMQHVTRHSAPGVRAFSSEQAQVPWETIRSASKLDA